MRTPVWVWPPTHCVRSRSAPLPSDGRAALAVSDNTMIFARPINEVTFDDIQALVDSEEPEGITLEYKQAVDTSQGRKKELAKDLLLGLDRAVHDDYFSKRKAPRSTTDDSENGNETGLQVTDEDESESSN